MRKTKTSIKLDLELANRAMKRALDYGVRGQSGTVHFALMLLASSKAGTDGSLICNAEEVRATVRATQLGESSGTVVRPVPKRMVR